MVKAYYSEIDPYAAAWLRNLIAAGHIAPGDVDERDIRDVRPDDLRGYRQCHFFAGIGVWSHAFRLAGWPDDREVWTGSCPCQPFSAAGRGAGFADERHLWPAFHWLIGQRRPAVVIGEQVASSAADPWIDLVQHGLEALGYAVAAVPLPAAGIGAPHLRDRLWWVADANLGAGRQGRAVDGWRDPRGDAVEGAGPRGDGGARLLANPGGAGPQGRAEPGQRIHAQRQAAERGGRAGGVADLSEPRRHEQPQWHDRADGRPAAEPGRLCAAGGVADADGRHAGAEGLQRGGQHRQQPTDGGTGRMADADRAGPFAGQRDDQAARHRHSAAAARGDDRHDAAGPLHGFWRDADWLLCRDGKWRPVMPASFPLVDGAAFRLGSGSPLEGKSRVGMLRAAGNAIVAPLAAEFIAAYLSSTEGGLDAPRARVAVAAADLL